MPCFLLFFWFHGYPNFNYNGLSPCLVQQVIDQLAKPIANTRRVVINQSKEPEWFPFRGRILLRSSSQHKRHINRRSSTVGKSGGSHACLHHARHCLPVRGGPRDSSCAAPEIEEPVGLIRSFSQ